MDMVEHLLFVQSAQYTARVEALNLWRNARRELDSFRRTYFVHELLKREEARRGHSSATLTPGVVPKAAPPLPSPKVRVRVQLIGHL